LTPGVSRNIRIFGTYISNSGYRSTEAIAGNDSGPTGWYPFSQTSYASYPFDTPSPGYPVTFQVDMTEQIANGTFNPGNGDTVYAAGTFQNTPWTGFQLTNNPAAANTNIYTGTYIDYNLTNSVELFKFNKVVSGVTDYEGVDNRPFTLLAPGVTNALIYFDDLFAIPSATTNAVTFTIDMGPEISLGNFNPSLMQIEVLGTFENPKWTAGFVLTNDPNSSLSNIYSGTILDGNYPGTFEEYKFVISTNGGGLNFESFNGGLNRTFFTPTNAGALTRAFFNEVLGISIPVTFQVDMTVPLLSGQFNPANGDTCGAAGTFQANQWNVGTTNPSSFLLTNNPTAANSNVYSGTCLDPNGPGTGEQYKFVINSTNNGASTIYESPASTDGGNRLFVLGSVAATNPLVFWSDIKPDQVLPAATTITFTVDMTGATNASGDIFGVPFDQNNDDVIINGDFVTPAWNVYPSGTPPFFWTDNNFYWQVDGVTVANDYGPGNSYSTNSFILTEVGDGLLYSGTYMVPAGHSLQVNYKYGIYHNTSAALTNCDNEAGSNLNHTRYIRATGTYNFPMDIFGQEQTNQAAATEPPFGSLAIGKPAGGSFPINWLGLPGVHLQYSTNLASTNWVDVNATSGTSGTNWPMSGASQQFFRLIQP
jgi:hypothetical protein